jgi:hypothetical protein
MGNTRPAEGFADAAYAGRWVTAAGEQHPDLDVGAQPSRRLGHDLYADRRVAARVFDVFRDCLDELS